MAHLIVILVLSALLVGFLVLTGYESRRGTRFYASGRARLDTVVARVEFVLAHVNLGVFLRDEIRHFAGRIGHDLVHASLLTVRSVERLLTRLIRRLRTHPEVDTAPRETAREFVKVLSEFKGNLKATRPEISDISEVQ
ncbi:hypothetical protein HKL94_00900 [Candidatus Parcubacteria bacterium]|nr:hypothetical protein [Candidatus Parcubacteria bacterium]